MVGIWLGESSADRGAQVFIPSSKAVACKHDRWPGQGDLILVPGTLPPKRPAPIPFAPVDPGDILSRR